MINEKRINSDPNSISDKEKEFLKSKITTSIFSFKRKNRLRNYGIGISGSMAFLFIALVVLPKNRTSSIDGYLKAAKNVSIKNHENVKLILDNKTEIDIAGEQSMIKYSNNGKQIDIKNHDLVEQSTTDKDQVIYNTIIVPYGKRSQIELSDGSIVWLNSGSKLVYPVTFTENKRKVYLEGEGIFDITHRKDQPFIVLAENHEIEVLGTVFNVSNYPDEDTINTVLKSGSVQITYKTDSFFESDQVLKIQPGMLASYHKSKKNIASKKVDIKSHFSWRNGVFIFKHHSLKYIMKSLSRYYNVAIVINNKELETQTFSGHLDLKDTLKEVIDLINETSDFQYEVNNLEASPEGMKKEKTLIISMQSR